MPTTPIIFGKFSNALAAHGDDILLPVKTSRQFDYEAELCVVIGSQARSVSASSAEPRLWLLQRQ